MNEPKRRFFSGDTLQQALIQAANHFHLAPEEISYRSIEKRHGFLKTRRKVLIEVDPEAPRRAPGTPPPPPAPARPVAAAPPSPAPSSPPAREARPERRDEAPERDRGPRPDRGDHRGERGERGDRGRDRDRGDRRGRIDRPRPPQREAERAEREERPERVERFEEEPATRSRINPDGLVALPDMPRRPSERYPEATGPVAAAAARSMELLLRIAGLELTPRILQGEDRLEVDLSGADVDWCFADDGELVVSVEHLLPRMIRSLAGEAPLVRVDCDNFQEIREERLRSLAQEVAEEVRRKGRPRTLEPMNPADRRIVHITLADDPGVVSESSGDGYFKRVTIRPT